MKLGPLQSQKRDYTPDYYHFMPIDAYKLWLPDVFILNNADSNKIRFEYDSIAYAYKVLVYSDGNVSWVHQIQVKSRCTLDWTYWPFDQQSCNLEFGSWTHNGFYLNMSFYQNKDHMDLSHYR